MCRFFRIARPVVLITVLWACSRAGSEKVISFDEEKHYSQTVGFPPFGNVFHFKLGAGNKTAIHRHDHDFLVVPLGKWDMQDDTAQKTMRLRGGSGTQVFYMRGGSTHRMENIGDSTARAVVIELTNPPGANSAVKIQDGAPGEFLLVFEKLLVYKIRIEPHGETHQRRERQSFVIALTDYQDGETRVHARPGMATSSPDGHFDFYNPSKKPAEVLVVEERW